MEASEGYESLCEVLDEAVEQASRGKGRERHAEDGEPYERQIICEVARRVGLGYPLGQAVKKIYESQRIGGEKGRAELLGAINYIAAGAIVMQEDVDEEREEAVRDHDFLCKAFSGEQAFQVGEHVQYRIAELSEGARWLDAWYLDRIPNGRGHIVKSKSEGRIAVDPDKIRKAPKAEGCEELVQKDAPLCGERCEEFIPGLGTCEGCRHAREHDAPQTPQELCQHIVDCNPATFGCVHKPTGEELAEMAEEEKRG